MVPPLPIRRLLLVPLVIVIAAALAMLTPAVALLTAVFNMIGGRGRRGRVRRSRLLRVAWLGLVWRAGQTPPRSGPRTASRSPVRPPHDSAAGP